MPFHRAVGVNYLEPNGDKLVKLNREGLDELLSHTGAFGNKLSKNFLQRSPQNRPPQSVYDVAEDISLYARNLDDFCRQPDKGTVENQTNHSEKFNRVLGAVLEYDRFAVRGVTEGHSLTDRQRECLATLMEREIDDVHEIIADYAGRYDYAVRLEPYLCDQMTNSVTMCASLMTDPERAAAFRDKYKAYDSTQKGEIYQEAHARDAVLFEFNKRMHDSIRNGIAIDGTVKGLAEIQVNKHDLYDNFEVVDHIMNKKRQGVDVSNQVWEDVRDMSSNYVMTSSYIEMQENLLAKELSDKAKSKQAELSDSDDSPSARAARYFASRSTPDGPSTGLSL